MPACILKHASSFASFGNENAIPTECRAWRAALQSGWPLPGPREVLATGHMIYSLNSLKGLCRALYRAAIKGDTRSFDYGSWVFCVAWKEPKLSAAAPACACSDPRV